MIQSKIAACSFPLGSIPRGIASVRFMCHDGGQWPQSFHVPRRGLHLPCSPPLANPLEDFLNSDRVSFFCFCCVFCVACGACGTAVFSEAGAFNQDIGRWDVSTVTNMGSSKCLPHLSHEPVRGPFLTLTGPRSSVGVVCFVLLVARVGTCAVFYSADLFDQDIGSWDVSAVTTMDASKCLPLLSHVLFPSCIDPREGFTCTRVVAPTTTANGPSPFTCRAHLVFTCLAHFLLANPFEDLVEL